MILRCVIVCAHRSIPALLPCLRKLGINIDETTDIFLSGMQVYYWQINDLFEDIVAHFNYYVKSDDEINGLSNLTLLDSHTNRSYKNAVFPIKRKTIIDRDKSGSFIPIGTKNVFLKYFSEYPPRISFWTQDDRNKYDEDLRNILNEYMEVNND